MERIIAVIGFDQNTVLDLVGPAESFHTANAVVAQDFYRIVIASPGGGAVRSEMGLKVSPDCSLDELDKIDTLIIPGGQGLRDPNIAAPVVQWIKSAEPRIRRVTSVCTGLFGLAATGLLDGRRATTHWRFANQIRARYPAIRLEPDSIFVGDGKFYTSAGVTAGIDLALALIEQDLGPGTSLAVARELVVYVKRPGGQRQFSDLLRFQTTSAPKMREMVHFIESRLGEDLTVNKLAAKANLSVRHFTRLFQKELGAPPAEFVERARLSAAIQHLTQTQTSIDRVAFALGYQSADAFSRAFRRCLGIAPSEYRERFRSGR